MDVDKIVAFAANFEKMAQTKMAPMGNPNQPDIRGMYTNINLLMDYAVGQFDYILEEVLALNHRVKALEQ